MVSLFLEGNISDLIENYMSTSSLIKMNVNYYMICAEMFFIDVKIFFNIWPNIAFFNFQFFINWTKTNVGKINEYIP